MVTCQNRRNPSNKDRSRFRKLMPKQLSIVRLKRREKKIILTQNIA